MERLHDPGLPADVTEIWRGNDWIVYYSRRTGCVYIYPTTYHPLALAISAEKLDELLGWIHSTDAGEGLEGQGLLN